MPALRLPFVAASLMSLCSLRSGAAALLILMAAPMPTALACGGGGGGAYRKPPRPDQVHQHGTTSNQAKVAQPAAPLPQ